jgi:hypothetical protein
MYITLKYHLSENMSFLIISLNFLELHINEGCGSVARGALGSLRFFIDLTLPVYLWPMDLLSLKTDISTRDIS